MPKLASSIAAQFLEPCARLISQLFWNNNPNTDLYPLTMDPNSKRLASRISSNEQLTSRPCSSVERGGTKPGSGKHEDEESRISREEEDTKMGTKSNKRSPWPEFPTRPNLPTRIAKPFDAVETRLRANQTEVRELMARTAEDSTIRGRLQESQARDSEDLKKLEELRERELQRRRQRQLERSLRP